MDSEKIYNNEDNCPVCYFRSTASYPNKKLLIQITERCNLHCEHCFLSATSSGKDIEYNKFQSIILPFLKNSSVTKVTITGGEPFLYTHLSDVIDLLLTNNISVSICSNASLVTTHFLEKYKSEKNLHINVSLDGFSAESHGKFRGNGSPVFFEHIIDNIRLIAKYGLLNGILVTPNKYASIDEYIEICNFAKSIGANYVLMNPLSQFGRGEDSFNLAMNIKGMQRIIDNTTCFSDENFEVVYIRFPNNGRKLSQCVAGRVLYMFTNGNITICPYLVFASKNKISKYDPEQFMIGNISNIRDLDLALSQYKLPMSKHVVSLCDECPIIECGHGCLASKISRGLLLSDPDIDLCPIYIKKDT